MDADEPTAPVRKQIIDLTQQMMDAVGEGKADVWQRTLLEHYCAKLAPDDFLPHPAMDGEHVIALIGDDMTSNATLLEYYVAHAVDHALSPHILFASRDYVLRHPELLEGASGGQRLAPLRARRPGMSNNRWLALSTTMRL